MSEKGGVNVRALRSVEPDKTVRYIHSSEARGLSAEHKYGYSREPFSLDVFYLYVKFNPTKKQAFMKVNRINFY